MKHLMMLWILLTAQVLRADDNPPTSLPEPNDSWESVQISNGSITWESKSEVAPGRTLYTNVWFVNYFKEAYRIGINDLDNLSILQVNEWCRDNMNRRYCQIESPYYWFNNFKYNDKKFCKLLGKNSSLDFKITAIKKLDENHYLVHVLINEDLKVYKTGGSRHGLLSVVCAD